MRVRAVVLNMKRIVSFERPESKQHCVVVAAANLSSPRRHDRQRAREAAIDRERIRHRALAAESSGLPPDGL